MFPTANYTSPNIYIFPIISDIYLEIFIFTEARINEDKFKENGERIFYSIIMDTKPIQTVTWAKKASFPKHAQFKDF